MPASHEGGALETFGELNRRRCLRNSGGASTQAARILSAQYDGLDLEVQL